MNRLYDLCNGSRARRWEKVMVDMMPCGELWLRRGRGEKQKQFLNFKRVFHFIHKSFLEFV
jgi:hypothetical protein